MKKRISIAIFVLLMLCLPCAAYSQVYFIAEKDGHIYKQPHESSLVLSNFIKGQVIEWRRIRTPDDWLAVRVKDISGYVRKIDGKVITGVSNAEEALQVYRYGDPVANKISRTPENFRIPDKEKKVHPSKVRDLWDYLQAIGPFFIGLVALAMGMKDQIFNFFRRPRLDMLFDQNEEGYYHKLLFKPLEEIHDPVTNTRYVIRQPGFNSRVHITNRGKTMARKVQAWLVDIAVYDNEKKFIKREVYHPSIIKWSGEREYHPIDIPPGSKLFLDLIYAVSETKEDVLTYHGELGQSTLKRILGDKQFTGDVFWNACIDTSYPRGIPPKYTKEGHFELNFIVFAENCKPHKFAVSVDWDRQKWNRPDIKRIKA